MKFGPLPDACRTQWNRAFTASGPHWIRGFMAFQLARRTRTVMLMVSVGPESGFLGTRGYEPPGPGPLAKHH
jgi:hypothetical protein